MQTGIKKIEAKEILDSRGTPTISVTVQAEGAKGSFDVPSGASTGSHEALELRDENEKRFRGMGVLLAVKNVNEVIAPVLLDINVADQELIDKRLLELDGTPNKVKLGANAILGVSIAAAKAAAAVKGVEVYEHLRDLASVPVSKETPFLYMNLINGGLHARSHLAFQEYLLVPQTEDIEEALEVGTGVMRALLKIVTDKYGPSSANLGDEGGCAPDVSDIEEPLRMILEASKTAGYENKIKLAMDVAATSFWTGADYMINKKKYSADELKALYGELISKYPILSIEDPFMEEAFADFNKLNDGKVLVVGDDLTVTNKDRLKQAVETRAVSGLIIKPNQIGTLTETIEVMKLARENNLECIVSHRSGDTKDDFIADLAYAYGTFGLKSGAPQRGERVVKYNRLWEIAKKKNS